MNILKDLYSTYQLTKRNYFNGVVDFIKDNGFAISFIDIDHNWFRAYKDKFSILIKVNDDKLDFIVDNCGYSTLTKSININLPNSNGEFLNFINKLDFYINL